MTLGDYGLIRAARNRLFRAIRQLLPRPRPQTPMMKVIDRLAANGFALTHGHALEVFGGTGTFHTQDYFKHVASLDIWEHNPALESVLRENLPGANVKITDSFEEIKTTKRRYDLVVVDNFMSISESPNGERHCEHFDLMPHLFRLYRQSGVLVLNVIPCRTEYATSAYPHLFDEEQLKARSLFYGTDSPDNVPIDQMLPFYSDLIAKHGFQVEWYFVQQRTHVYYLVFKIRRQPDRARITLAHGESELADLIGSYFSDDPNVRPAIVSSVLHLKSWQDAASYFRQIKTTNYKSAFYPYNRSLREGFYSKEFRFDNFIPDIVAVNSSKKVRQGREMGAAYRRSVQDFGGPPNEEKPVLAVQHHDRFRKSFGVFRKRPGYKQGDIVTNEQLLGYISFLRDGNICLYAQILGHASFLQLGIMYNLHFHIIEWLYSNDPVVQAVEYLMYAGHFDGGEGLRKWKEKLLFKPTEVYLTTRDDDDVQC